MGKWYGPKNDAGNPVSYMQKENVYPPIRANSFEIFTTGVQDLPRTHYDLFWDAPRCATSSSTSRR
jgi:hypothetical protein